MANLSEPSSSLSFTSPSYISNGSMSHNYPTPLAFEAGSTSSPEVVSLTKLSTNLGQLLNDFSPDYSDADIVVEGVSVGVHRCILAARSKFFHELFKREKGTSEKEGKPTYCMTQLIPYTKVGYEAFLIFLSYLYTGQLKSYPVDVSTCVDNVCPHDACRPAINFSVELMYASSIFQVPELVSVFQRRLVNFVEKAQVEDVIPILLVSFHCEANQLLDQCVERIARSNLDSISIEKELPYEVAESIELLRKKSLSDGEQDTTLDPLREKRIKRILKALDSDDVELVKLLLTESEITLDDANALHYAAAYCDHKVVTEVLSLDLANLRLPNARGYTVLHIAAMRKQPEIIVSLLEKGASASDLTFDGQSAVNICRRLTRPKDYYAKIERGQESNKDRICINVLETEMRRNPMAGDNSDTFKAMSDDLHMKLLYLENRVAFARLLFPAEAKLAMGNAHAETTSEFAGISAARGSSGNLREVDLNETPVGQKKRLQTRMEALMKTVETGRRYFPNCSEVIDKLMDDDFLDLLDLERGTPDEQGIRRTRYMELKEDIHKAFDKDKAEKNYVLSSASSTTCPKGPLSKRARKL